MTKKLIMNFIGFSLLTTTMTYAATTSKNDSHKTNTHPKICLTEDCISTIKLQEEVEKLSIEGKLPFEMGLELMKRWSDNKIS
jgi:hypothetical protein